MLFEFKKIQSMSEADLREEAENAGNRLDKCTLLLAALVNARNDCEALAAYYARQKGHEVFMLALETVIKTAEVRITQVGRHGADLMKYYNNIMALLGEEIVLVEEWESFEQIAEWLK